MVKRTLGLKLLRSIHPILSLVLCLLTSWSCVSASEQDVQDAGGALSLAFASDERLEEHWVKHRSEFGQISRDEYLQRARTFFADESADKETKQRENGDELHFNASTSEFGVLSDDNTIRTYFRPNSGRRYWERQ